MVRPGASEWIEEQFPQVPPQTSGKSRTAFVQFTTHQTAREVKGSISFFYLLRFYRTVKLRLISLIYRHSDRNSAGSELRFMTTNAHSKKLLFRIIQAAGRA